MDNSTITAQEVFAKSFSRKMSDINFYGEITVVWTGGQITNAHIKQGFLDKDRKGNPVNYQIILLEVENK